MCVLWMKNTMLWDSEDTWIVLTRAPFAFGPFDGGRAVAQQFAERIGGVAVTWFEPEWVTPHFPPDWGAAWFDGNWDNPFVVGPFYDIAEAAKWGDGDGIAVELDTCVEEHPLYPDENDCAA